MEGKDWQTRAYRIESGKLYYQKDEYFYEWITPVRDKGKRIDSKKIYYQEREWGGREPLTGAKRIDRGKLYYQKKEYSYEWITPEPETRMYMPKKYIPDKLVIYTSEGVMEVSSLEVEWEPPLMKKFVKVVKVVALVAVALYLLYYVASFITMLGDGLIGHVR